MIEVDPTVSFGDPVGPKRVESLGPANDAIPRAEKQLAYELWRAATDTPKWLRRIKRRLKHDLWWNARKYRAERKRQLRLREEADAAMERRPERSVHSDAIGSEVLPQESAR